MAKTETVAYVRVLLIFRDQVEFRSEMTAGSSRVRGYRECRWIDFPSAGYADLQSRAVLRKPDLDAPRPWFLTRKRRGDTAR